MVVFSVALLDDAPFLGVLGCEEPQRGVGKDRGKALGIIEGPIFVVPEDNYAAFGAVWIVVSSAFDPWSCHSWYGIGCVAVAAGRHYYFRLITV